MKKLLAMLICACMLLGGAWAEENETLVVLSDEQITVNGEAISEDVSAPVHLVNQIEIHEDVPEELEGLSNRVVTITAAGTYRFSGTASDAQIAVRAGEADAVRIILDGVDITCRTAPAIAGYTALEPAAAGEYGIAIELAGGSRNSVTGSHTEEIYDGDVKLSGAISSLVSIGFEGSGSLNVDADNEGIEVKFGHMTFNGGSFHIEANDDPINVSEDGVGTLTVNDGYLFSSVKPEQGGEGDGVDSNGYIVFNGGTIINLAHPTSGDSGIDSDMGSSINGGIVVGAGNMYDPIDASSKQLFMMLEFAVATDDLVVVTDADNNPVFAYDFPHSYTYIAFSTPELAEGTYHVYLGGEIEGEQQDGLYTSITSYTPGMIMQHGGGTAAQGMMDMGGAPGMQMPEGVESMPERPEDMPETPEGMENMPQPEDAPEWPDMQMPENMEAPEPRELPEGMENRGFGGQDAGGRGFGGMGGGPRGMESSADTATSDFVLTRENTGFTNISSAN